MTSSTPSDNSSNPLSAAVHATVQAVNWDSILRTVRDKLGATTAHWGQQKSGGYNIVRFLHLDEDQVVVRLPLFLDPERSGPVTPKTMHRNIRNTASMLASMEYVATHTNIPVPRIIHSSLDAELDDVGSPYVVLSKVEGIQLSYFWSEMPDTQRDIVLAQVVDILLDMSTLRFDKIGSLFKTDDGGWRVEPSPGDDDVPEATYTSGIEESLAFANARLRKIQYNRFGYVANEIDYTRHWFMRSLIPCFYDNSLDAKGFPLMHDDFHTQNILVTDVDTHPRITGIIDWDDAATVSTSSFCQYPLFIVDHPLWPKDHPIRPRNIRDQASFDRLMAKAEKDKFQDTTLPSLSHAFSNSAGLYMLEQCIHYEYIYHKLFWELVRHVFGPDVEESDWDAYTDGLERGLLKDVVERLAEETDVVDEARKVLRGQVNVDGLSREEFIKVAEEHKDQFSTEGKVLPWLKKVAIAWKPTVANGGHERTELRSIRGCDVPRQRATTGAYTALINPCQPYN